MTNIRVNIGIKDIRNLIKSFKVLTPILQEYN